MLEEAKILDHIRELCLTQRHAVLATHYGGQPYVNIVAFLVTDDLCHLLFATPTATRKYRNLTADPRVSLLVDNRKNEPEDLHKAMAVTISGRVCDLSLQRYEMLKACFLARHPYLADFVHNPANTLVAVQIEQFDLVLAFQQVYTIKRMPCA